MEELTAALGYGITEGRDGAFTTCEKLKYWLLDWSVKEHTFAMSTNS